MAQAHRRTCCLASCKTYCLKATELRDKLRRAADSGCPSKMVASLVKPSCLMIGEVGRCVFDRMRTGLSFDVIDRRCEKDRPSTMMLTSSAPVSRWGELFAGGDALLCVFDRVFDRATVFIMKGASFRGAELETLTVESSPMATKLRK